MTRQTAARLPRHTTGFLGATVVAIPTAAMVHTAAWSTWVSFGVTYGVAVTAYAAVLMVLTLMTSGIPQDSDTTEN